jgi:hypothetical protein
MRGLIDLLRLKSREIVFQNDIAASLRLKGIEMQARTALKER